MLRNFANKLTSLVQTWQALFKQLYHILYIRSICAYHLFNFK